MTSIKNDLDAELSSMMGELRNAGILQLQKTQVQLNTLESFEPPVHWVSTTTSGAELNNANTRTHFQ